MHATLRMAAPVKVGPDLPFHAKRCPSWHEQIGRRAVAISLSDLSYFAGSAPTNFNAR